MRSAMGSRCPSRWIGGTPPGGVHLLGVVKLANGISLDVEGRVRFISRETRPDGVDVFLIGADDRSFIDIPTSAWADAGIDDDGVTRLLHEATGVEFALEVWSVA